MLHECSSQDPLCVVSLDAAGMFVAGSSLSSFCMYVIRMDASEIVPASNRLPIWNFRRSVKDCISRSIMTTERQRWFSRRARQYMLVYHAIDNVNTEDTTNGNTTTPEHWGRGTKTGHLDDDDRKDHQNVQENLQVTSKHRRL